MANSVGPDQTVPMSNLIWANNIISDLFVEILLENTIKSTCFVAGPHSTIGSESNC